MIQVEHELMNTAGSRFYDNFDFTHGYWQLPLHRDSQECHALKIPGNELTLTRFSHGTTNTVLKLQSFIMIKLPPDFRTRRMLWVDDFLLNEKPIEALINDIRRFLRFLVEFN